MKGCCTFMFDKYPDVVNTSQLQIMLGLSKNSIMELLNSNQIKYFRKGKKYLIPKVYVIDYVISSCALQDFTS